MQTAFSKISHTTFGRIFEYEGMVSEGSEGLVLIARNTPTSRWRYL